MNFLMQYMFKTQQEFCLLRSTRNSFVTAQRHFKHTCKKIHPCALFGFSTSCIKNMRKKRKKTGSFHLTSCKGGEEFATKSMCLLRARIRECLKGFGNPCQPSWADLSVTRHSAEKHLNSCPKYRYIPCKFPRTSTKACSIETIEINIKSKLTVREEWWTQCNGW